MYNILILFWIAQWSTSIYLNMRNVVQDGKSIYLILNGLLFFMGCIEAGSLNLNRNVDGFRRAFGSFILIFLALFVGKYLF